MPVDTRRIAGPEETRPVIPACGHQNEPLLNDEGKRSDGRMPAELRPVFLRAGVVTQAKGSAYIEMKKTKIVCSVYGPRESTKRQEFSIKGKLTCEFKFAPFSCQQRRQPVQDSEEKEFSSLIVRALEPAVCLDKFPKAQVDIYVTVLENDGGTLAAAIICSAVALGDAGIEMYDLVSACSLVQCGTVSVLDPTQQEIHARGCDGTLTVAFLPSLNMVSGLIQDGELSQDVVVEATKSCTEGSVRMYDVIQQSLVKSLSRKLETER